MTNNEAIEHLEYLECHSSCEKEAEAIEIAISALGGRDKPAPKIGDKVKFTDEKAHQEFPGFYPKPGTVGKVLENGKGNAFFIKWEEGSTSGADCWFADSDQFERNEVQI